MTDQITIANRPFTLTALTAETASRDQLDAAAAEIFGLFITREAAFRFNPDVVTEYPAIDADSPFLTDPASHIAARLEAADAPFGRIVVLTTFADQVGAALAADGFTAHPIDMPAGPDHTAAFTRDLDAASARTLYLEAVNEADEKIRSNFALRLLDEKGALKGGACGSIHTRSGRRYAYLATMTLAAGLPPGTGTVLAGALLDLLRQQGVATVHLGTQTAGPFYEKLGFRITHRLIPGLRNRISSDGRTVAHDLVMMCRDLAPA